MKTYAVDVHWDVAKQFKVDAESLEEAQEKIWNLIERGNVCVWSDGFEATDDVEVETVGEENDDGSVEYY